MSVKGKKAHQYLYITFSDFGTPGRRERLQHHYSRTAAENAFKRLRKIYSFESSILDHHLYRCWQEERHNHEIINDTGSPWHATVR